MELKIKTFYYKNGLKKIKTHTHTMELFPERDRDTEREREREREAVDNECCSQQIWIW
jgi:hypothetical protein